MDLFHASGVPLMARRNYLIEVRHLLLWGIFAGMFEGSVSSIVAAKTFHAGPWLITVVMATPMLANLMGLIWGAIASRRRKLPLFMGLASGTALMIGSIAFADPTPFGGWIFAGQILVARALLSGCMTIRSGLWKHNYPTAVRGRVAARLQFVRFSFAIGMVTTVSLLFDWNPDVYRFAYPLAAIVGIIAVFALRGMHVRGEVAALAAIRREDRANPKAKGGLLGPVRSAVTVLREDADYRRYCTAMMFLGSANIMVMPIMTIIVTKELFLSYYHSCNLIEVMPRILMMGTLMPWARLFDRVGVVRFRILNATAWTGASLFGGIGAAVLMWPGSLDATSSFAIAVSFVALSRLCEGMGKGGGAIAWNIGHLHFADPSKAEIYMGTHVFLTGLRGLCMPFLGTLLYTRYGAYAFIVSTSLACIGLWMFVLLARRQREAEDLQPQLEQPAEEPEIVKA